LAVAFTVIGRGGLRADFNAGQIQTLFNSMNGGNGLVFRYDGGTSPALRGTGTDSANTNAYLNTAMSDLNQVFRSYCVNPLLGISTGVNYHGNLNLQANGTTLNAGGVALTVGAAYLYKVLATTPTSAMSSGPYEIFSNLSTTVTPGRTRETHFQEAIYALMGLATASADNIYMQFLANQFPGRSLEDYWKKEYSSTQRYDEIGDYFVFVMNVHNASTNAPAQDFMYIAHATWTTSGVPEPATFLFWTLGGLGLVCTSQVRNRRLKRLALA